MKITKNCIELFWSANKEYGGFGHFLSSKVFRSRYTYIDIYLKRKWKVERRHRNDKDKYDGCYHNHLWIGFILISYGT